MLADAERDAGPRIELSLVLSDCLGLGFKACVSTGTRFPSRAEALCKVAWRRLNLTVLCVRHSIAALMFLYVVARHPGLVVRVMETFRQCVMRTRKALLPDGRGTAIAWAEAGAEARHKVSWSMCGSVKFRPSMITREQKPMAKAECNSAFGLTLCDAYHPSFF